MKEEKIRRLCKHLDEEILTIKDFLQRIVAIKYRLVEEALDYVPAEIEIEEWNHEEIDFEDCFPAENQTTDPINESKCVSCHQNDINTVFNTCGHSIICHECCYIFEGPDSLCNQCPVCDEIIENVIKIRK